MSRQVAAVGRSEGRARPHRSQPVRGRCGIGAVREISNAVNPTSHRNRGGASSSSRRPTCNTQIVSAPCCTARSSGMLLTRPPSKKCSLPICTGGKTPGSAQDASTGSMRSPVLNQCSRACSMLAATHSNGTASSSKVCDRQLRAQHSAKLTVAMQRRPAADDFCQPPKHRAVECSLIHQRVPKRQQPPRAGGVGSAASAAPLIAPTDVPQTTSGRIPASSNALAMPASAAPSRPPPPSTNAWHDMRHEYPRNGHSSRMTAWRNGLAPSTVCPGGAVFASGGLFVACPDPRSLDVDAISDDGRHRGAGSRRRPVTPACGDGPALLASMSTRDKLAQLLMVGVTGAADATGGRRQPPRRRHLHRQLDGPVDALRRVTDRHRRIGGPAAARGQRRRGGRPGVAAGRADRQPAVAAGARGQPHARRGVQHRAGAWAGDEKARHHHRLRTRSST